MSGIQQFDKIAPREIFPGMSGRFFHTAHMTFALWDIREGSPLPEHHHPHEQIVQMIEGEFEMIIGGVKYVLGPGQIAVIPGNVPHSGRAITRCRILDTFSPVREDYR